MRAPGPRQWASKHLSPFPKGLASWSKWASLFRLDFCLLTLRAAALNLNQCGVRGVGQPFLPRRPNRGPAFELLKEGLPVSLRTSVWNFLALAIAFIAVPSRPSYRSNPLLERETHPLRRNSTLNKLAMGSHAQVFVPLDPTASSPHTFVPVALDQHLYAQQTLVGGFAEYPQQARGIVTPQAQAAQSKAQVLKKMRPATITLSIFILLVSLFTTVVGGFMFRALGPHAMWIASGYTLASPMILIFNMVQMAYAISAPKSLLRVAPRIAFMMSIFGVVGFVATLVATLMWPVYLLPLSIPVFILAALQCGYAHAAYLQSARLSTAEQSGLFYAPQSQDEKVTVLQTNTWELSEFPQNASLV